MGLGGKGPLLCILGGSGSGAGCLATLTTLVRLGILLNWAIGATAFFTGAITALLPRSCATGTMRIPFAGLDDAEVDVGLGAWSSSSDRSTHSITFLVVLLGCCCCCC